MIQDPDSALTPEGMLQQAGVSDLALVEALVRLYGRELEQLASFLQPDPSRSREVLTSALAAAVAGRHSYWGSPPLRLWLLRLLLDSSQKARPFHRRANNAALLLFLRYGLGLACEEIGVVWGRDRRPLPELDIHIRLVAARRAAVPTLAPDRRSSTSHPFGVEWIEARADAVLTPDLASELEDHLAGCEPCQAFAHRLAEAEALFTQELKIAPRQAVGVSEASLPAQVTARAGRVTPSRRLSLAVKALTTFAGILLIMAAAFSLFRQEKPAATVTATPTPAPQASRAYRPPPFTYLYHRQDRETLAEIAERAHVSVEQVLAVNGFELEQAERYLARMGQVTLPAPLSLRFDWIEEPFEPPASPGPLTDQSDPQVILQRMIDGNPYWRTLWVDFYLFENGPPGVIGPALYTLRGQVWSAQPGYRILLLGDDIYYIIIYFLDEMVFFSDQETQVQAYPVEAMEEIFHSWPFYGHPFFTRELIEPGLSLRVMGQEPVAGREAVVIELLDENGQPKTRLWVDAVLGLILRSQILAEGNAEWVLSEFIITDISINVRFSSDIFVPGSGALTGFVHDYTARPFTGRTDPPPFEPPPPRLPPERFAPPPGYDLTRASIALAWPSPREREAPSGGLFEIGLYADEYYIGAFNFPESFPRSLYAADNYWSFHSCLRSPDGATVAFVASPGDDRLSQAGWLFWFRLDGTTQAALQLIHIPKIVFYTDYAFSPDSQTLAVLDCNYVCRYTLIDLASNNFSDLALQAIQRQSIYWASSIAWSPDGRFLAALVQSPQHFDMALVVQDVQTGEVIYESDYVPYEDWLSAEIPPNAPVARWGIQYPPLPLIQRGCAQP